MSHHQHSPPARAANAPRGGQVMIGKEGRGGGVAELRRIEVAALITVAAKFSHAIESVRRWEALDRAAAA